MKIAPRIIRLRVAPDYLGMNKNYFNQIVIPFLTVISIGAHGIGFDWLDLNSWADHYKNCNGRPEDIWRKLCDVKERQVSINFEASDTSTNKSTDIAFQKALALIASKKRKKFSL